MAKKKTPAKAANKTVKAKTKKAPTKASKAASKPARPSGGKSAPKKKAAKPVAKKSVAKKVVAKKAEPAKKVVVSVKAAPPKPAPPQLGAFPMLTQRPIAHVKPSKSTPGKDDRTRYSDEELKEFEKLIFEKLEKARGEYKILKDTLSRDNDMGTDSTSGGNTKVLEDGAETAEKENLSQLAARQQKFITNLENALVRIKNSTYGICSVTGKLISKERLIAVPHTTQSIEAKMMKQD
jgi:RNA polymerase-binding transcription factor DksA